MFLFIYRIIIILYIYYSSYELLFLFNYRTVAEPEPVEPKLFFENSYLSPCGGCKFDYKQFNHFWEILSYF